MIDLEELKRKHEFRDQGYMDGVAWRDAIAAAFPAIVAKLEAAQRLRDAVEGHRIWRTRQNKVAVIDAGLYSELAAFDKEQQ